jgi:hypothetical protein
MIKLWHSYNTLRGLFFARDHFDIPVRNIFLDAYPRPAVYRHPVHVRSRDAGTSGNRRLDATLPEPVNVSIYSMRLSAPRLAGEEYIHAQLQYRKCLFLSHRDADNSINEKDSYDGVPL